MRKIVVILLSIVSFLACHKNDRTEYRPIDLKCEYSVNPLGIDTDTLWFSWLLQADSMDIAKSKSLVWNSLKTESDANLVVYKGDKLLPNTKYFWAVKIWDEKGNESLLSDLASFETGLKNKWSAKWITDIEDVNEKRAPYFRKEVKTNSPIAKATVYLASAGLHELMLNMSLRLK